MPLQNRVDPFGDIHAVSPRGMFTGNRGIIHDPATRKLTGRRWTTRAWIICACDYKGLQRDVMGRNGSQGGAGWTELFFLDEVTALAAGHRPCFTCRRNAAKQFLALHGEATEQSSPRAPELDRHLHRERLASGGAMVELDRHGLDLLPDGAMVFDGAADFAIRGGCALPWSFDGYGPAQSFDSLGPSEMCILTPQTTLAVLARGYQPQWHASAPDAATPPASAG